MPPRDPKPAISRRKSTPKLDVQEPALTNMLEKYCDLRRRGFGQQAIQERMPEASITFAGGLSPQNVARISQEIRAQHTNPFSIDAEGALRTSEDHLNMRAAGLYISQATKMSQTPTQPIH